MTRDVQLRSADGKSVGAADIDVDAEHDPEVSRRASNAGLRREVQKKGPDGMSEEQVHAAAARGAGSPSQQLPFMDRIQQSFGQHDVSGIQAHVDGGSTRAMGAEAYASGNHVVFGQQPDLHTAAHEAAHVVQQAQGVNLKGGVGAEGDAYERAADAVADQVVAGKPAGHLLGPVAGGGGASGQAVQRKPAAKAVNPSAAHTMSDQTSMASVQSALVHLAKEFNSWQPQLISARGMDAKGAAGVGPAQNIVTGIFDNAKNDAERVSELIATADKDTRRFLSPDVKKVLGAFPHFYNQMKMTGNWLENNGGPKLDVHEIEVIVDGLPRAIGVEEKLEPDMTPPEGDEKALSKSMVKDQVDAIDAALTSVKSGNDKDAARITLHLRYLDGVAGEHAAELKSEKSKLKSFLKELDEIRQEHPTLADRLAEAHNHLIKLIK